MTQIVLPDRNSPTFSAELRSILDELGVSPYQLKNKLGISYTAVANWLSGNTKPRDAIYEELKAVLVTWADNPSEVEEKMLLKDATLEQLAVRAKELGALQVNFSF